MTQLPPLKDLPWIEIARRYIGQHEIPGAKHNNLIVSIWKRVKAPWFVDDETPWCAGFVAYCCYEAGLPIVGPAKVAQALAWADHGVALDRPAYGCIAVKARKGGGHVGFVVGRYADGRLAILGGNQDDAVRISPYPEDVFVAFRWPSKAPDPRRYQLPLVRGDGTPVGSEA